MTKSPTPQAIRPMLAGTITKVSQLKFPCYASVKLDGIRAIYNQGLFYSRSGKVLPNIYLQTFARYLHACSPTLSILDGEIMVHQAPDNSFASFHQTQSQVMSEHTKPNFTYAVFDVVEQNPFWMRLNTLISVAKILRPVTNKILYLHQDYLQGQASAERHVKETLSSGAEGVCFRSPDANYKHGRGTLTDKTLLKLKPMQTSEARLIRFEEKLLNTNEPILSPLGYTKRSSHVAGKLPQGTLGRALVQDLASGKHFYIGTFRLTEEEKQHLWNTRTQHVGKVLTYQHLPHGELDLPRNASFLGFRDELDRGETKTQAKTKAKA